MVAEADEDNSGEIDFNEFLALMTEKMGKEGEERLRHAKTAFWALQSYKYKGEGKGSTTSDWLCIGELQELMSNGELEDNTPIFTERFDDFRPISDVVEAEDAFAAALEWDYHQELMYVDDEQEESEEIPLVTVRELVRSGEVRNPHPILTQSPPNPHPILSQLTDETMVWTAAFANWATLSETRWQFGLAEVMMTELAIGGERDRPHLNLTYISPKPP